MPWDQPLSLLRGGLTPSPFCSPGAASALLTSLDGNAPLEVKISKHFWKDWLMEAELRFWRARTEIFFLLKCNICVSCLYHLTYPTSKTITAIMKDLDFFLREMLCKKTLVMSWGLFLSLLKLIFSIYPRGNNWQKWQVSPQSMYLLYQLNLNFIISFSWSLS